MSPAERATAAYRAAFGEAPARLAYAPGRVNLIGEHTDYNDGFVLPCAIDRGTAVAIGEGADDMIAVVSADYGETDRFDPAAPFALAPGWRTHVRAVAAVLRARGLSVGGMRIAIAGDVPQGAGLSSSASLGVALGAAFDTKGTLSRTELALVAQAAENDFVGCACGNMDQLIAAHGQAGAALLIDCRSLATTPVPLPDEMALLIVHSGITRGLVDSAYNERRAACEAVAAHFGIAALRDLDSATLAAGEGSLDPVAFRRARHVVSENARTLAMPAALAASDFAAIGALMTASHASMRDDFEITLPEIDRLVATMTAALGGVGGVRMTGGGFGGCVVAITQQALIPDLIAAAMQHFAAVGRAPGLIHSCRPSGGLAVGAVG
ncbi:galactokinase [Sphingomonas aquatica]|uniref:galactokinase n=2 Tax=Sphingomonas TaxID=13687 RepID=UPI00301E2C7C